MSSKRKTIVGIFVVAGVLLFAVGLYLIGGRGQLFASKFHVYADFKNIDTLQTGARVRVSGMDAGQVTGIRVPKDPSERFRLALQIDDKFHPIVREDSVASIETSGMVGSKYVNVSIGSAKSPDCPPGATLPSQEASSLGALMQKGNELVASLQTTIKDVRTRADSALQNITSAAGNANGMIVSISGNVKRIASNGANLTNNANAILADIRQGHGTAGKLLTDRTVASNVETTVADAKQATANLEQAAKKVDTIATNVEKQDLPDVQKTLANTQSMTSQLNKAVGTLFASKNENESTAVALRSTVHEAQQTMANLNDDTDAVKHNFFFRGFFHRRGFFDLQTLTPEEYPSTKFVKKPRDRVWLGSAGLFKVGVNGDQQITPAGHEILDQAMSNFVPYLPNNPIMVEGYAEGGSPSERYLVSRQRAFAVEQYLETHFHLHPELVGMMPLGDQPPAHAGKKMWNGISLVLVVSKNR